MPKLEPSSMPKLEASDMPKLEPSSMPKLEPSSMPKLEPFFSNTHLFQAARKRSLDYGGVFYPKRWRGGEGRGGERSGEERQGEERNGEERRGDLIKNSLSELSETAVPGYGGWSKNSLVYDGVVYPARIFPDDNNVSSEPSLKVFFFFFFFFFKVNTGFYFNYLSCTMYG